MRAAFETEHVLVLGPDAARELREGDAPRTAERPDPSADCDGGRDLEIALRPLDSRGRHNDCDGFVTTLGPAGPVGSVPLV